MKREIPLHQCCLYKCRSKRRLAAILNISYADLGNIPDWATYRIGSTEKNDGSRRVIYSPSSKLKSVQARIKRLLERIEKPRWVFSGTKGKCHVDNGRYHIGNSYFILTDIASFYESCSRNATYRFFLDDLRTSPDVAKLLTDITTLSIDGRCFIPTGSPTGQLLAYFSYRRMFEELEALASEEGCRLSLYVDDLTLSSPRPIANPKGLQKRMAKIMASYGHGIKWEKTRYIGACDYKVVTGVALGPDGKAHVPNRLGEKIIEGLEETLVGGISSQATTLGRINAARQIDGNAFPEAKRLLLSGSIG